MTIVNSFASYCDCFRENSRCSTCGDQLVPPFLMYCCGGDGLFLCSHCACHIKDGLTADLVQISAIVGYASATQARPLSVAHSPGSSRKNVSAGHRNCRRVN